MTWWCESHYCPFVGKMVNFANWTYHIDLLSPVDGV
ncbi:hypothetical protein BDE40_0090 [Litoreibacter halocynthiae]|uniref:Uncharacterized protein n=1 Tax=Litoreibacter halocynthiae TaxID=1242689 RepID=A0A4R7LLK0_9RHOB|nr:hypothetical protein BDE40_0090 [Litoreibacter halocynthiae]